jgi:hypothetical protein
MATQFPIVACGFRRPTLSCVPRESRCRAVPVCYLSGLLPAAAACETPCLQEYSAPDLLRPRCTAMSILIARLACLIGFLLLGYAAVDTIECACTTAPSAAGAVSSHREARLTPRMRSLLLTDRHTLQVSNQGFTWPRTEVSAVVVAARWGSRATHTPLFTRPLRVLSGCGRTCRGLAAGAVRCVA